MRRASLLASLASFPLVLSGCSSGGDDPPAPEPPAPSVTSREIRGFDFGNAEWFDPSVAETVTLEDGTYIRGAGAAVSPMSGGGEWRIVDGPRFSDADADGDEDAVVALATSGEQSANVGWYIWLWQDGTAVQLHQSIASTTRCSRPVEAVTAVPGGFEVRAYLFQDGMDNCAGGGAVPVTYVAGVRDGWPVRIRPDFGPIETCDPLVLTERTRPGGKVQLRVHPDGRAPEVEPARRYDSLRVDRYALDRYVAPERKWALTLAHRGEKVVCGWAHVDQLS